MFLCFSGEADLNPNFMIHDFFHDFYAGEVPTVAHRCVMKKQTAYCLRERKNEKYSLSTEDIKRKMPQESWSDTDNFRSTPNRCLINVMTTLNLLYFGFFVIHICFQNAACKNFQSLTNLISPLKHE